MKSLAGKVSNVVVCITTRNRNDVLEIALPKWQTLGVSIVIVDDASDKPVPNATYRFEERAGIPRAKNKCLEIAMSMGVEHIFLADDDVYPLCSHALRSYIDSPYKHLCYTFLDYHTIRDNHTYHYLGNGCMMYIHRDVVDKIGGFDTAFGIGKYEHAQFSNRVYASGLIPAPYIDVVGSSELFYSLDQFSEIERSMTQQEMAEQITNHEKYFYATERSKDFFKYL